MRVHGDVVILTLEIVVVGKMHGLFAISHVLLLRVPACTTTGLFVDPEKVAAIRSHSNSTDV